MNRQQNLLLILVVLAHELLILIKAFSLVREANNLNILELGCGDGRDASAIAPRVRKYLGSDYSNELLKIAQSRNLKNAAFQCADMRSFDFTSLEPIDIIFAFASLLHLNKNEIAQLFIDSTAAIKSGGIWYISLKYSESYRKEIKEDEYGRRLFFFYTPDEVAHLAGDAFTEVYRDFQTIGSTKWFTLALRKT